MSVSYIAEYGIGFEIIFDGSLEDYGQKEDYLDEVLKGSPYNYIEIGDEGYSGNPNTFYVVLNNDDLFRNGYNLYDKIAELIMFLKDKGINTYEIPAKIVGGLQVC